MTMNKRNLIRPTRTEQYRQSEGKRSKASEARAGVPDTSYLTPIFDTWSEIVAEQLNVLVRLNGINCNEAFSNEDEKRNMMR